MRMSSVVTEELVEQFHEDGYVFIPEFFDTESVERFRDEAVSDARARRQLLARERPNE